MKKYFRILLLIPFLFLSSCFKDSPKVSKRWETKQEKDMDPVYPPEVLSAMNPASENNPEVYIYLGVFSTEYFYDELLVLVKEQGLVPLTSLSKKGDKTLKTLRIGPFPRSQAEIIKNRLKKKEGFPKDIYLSLPKKKTKLNKP